MAGGEAKDADSVELARNASSSITGEIDPRAIGGDVSQLPKGYYTSFSFIGTLVACALGITCSNATFAMPINILTTINEELGPSPHYWWINLVWILSSCVMYAIGGRLSDILGRRWFFILGNAFGTIGAIIAATAKNVNTLIGANAFIGLAAAVQQLWPIALNELVPNKSRGYVSGFLWFCSVPFAVFSPVIARSLLNTSVGWRGCYYIATALTGAVTVLFLLFYRPPTFELLHKGKPKTLKSMLGMVDIGGTFLFSAGMVVCLLGINWGGIQYPWRSGPVIGCIIGGFALLVVFVFYELYHKQPYPLIPMRLFRKPGYTALVLGGAMVTLNYYNLSLLWPIQAQVVFQGSSIGIGWLTCATGGGTLIGDVLVAFLIRPVKQHRLMMISLSCAGAAFTAALAAVTPGTKSMAIVFVTLSGFCVGGVEAIVYTLSPLTCDPDDIGLATGVMLLVRTSAPSIATSIYSTVLNNKLSVNIPKYVGPAATGAGLPASEIPQLLAGFTSGSFTGVAGITPKIIAASTTAYQQAYMSTFRLIYLSTIAWGAMGILAAFFSPNMGHQLNNFVGRRLQGKEIAVLSEKDEGKQVKLAAA